MHLNKYDKLSLVVDMYGCPNRCKHCWLSHMPNKVMPEDKDLYIINYFKPYFDKITYYSWVREPDYMDSYKERWLKDISISINSKPLRFELASFYRLVRDKEYVHFLKDVGVKVVQLTFFGLRDMSDYFIGRKGAFNELLEATQILIENQIAPRWQCFINEMNKDEMIELIKLSKELHLKELCATFNQEFKLFIHPGTCDGENYKLYDIRINKESVNQEIIPYFLDYNDYLEEKELVKLLNEENSFIDFTLEDEVVLNISNELDVYFNFTHMLDEWKIGNILIDDSKQLMERINNMDVYAINEAKKNRISDLVKQYGDEKSNKLFDVEDYKMYLLLRHLDNLSK